MKQTFEDRLDNHRRELLKERAGLYEQKKTMEQIEQEVFIQNMKLEELQKFRKI